MPQLAASLGLLRSTKACRCRILLLVTAFIQELTAKTSRTRASLSAVISTAADLLFEAAWAATVAAAFLLDLPPGMVMQSNQNRLLQ